MRFDYITLTTDYGLNDEFAGVCHGVIAQIAPGARVIDITHGVEPFDVRGGALTLVRAIQYMPAGVHVAIVDPGVGTDRRAIAVEAGPSVMIGPDNGILSPAVAMLGGASRCVELTNEDYQLPRAGGQTFAGRDLFAPAAAQVALGTPLEEFGDEIDAHTLVPMLVPLCSVDADSVAGEILWIDRFGNAQLNISPGELEMLGASEGEHVEIEIGGTAIGAVFSNAYADHEEGMILLIVDSYGLLSVSVNRGRASDILGLQSATKVRLKTA